jgi:hypothetical protein
MCPNINSGFCVPACLQDIRLDPRRWRALELMFTKLPILLKMHHYFAIHKPHNLEEKERSIFPVPDRGLSFNREISSDDQFILRVGIRRGKGKRRAELQVRWKPGEIMNKRVAYD